MKIGIDISQLAHGNTGVANYVKNLVEQLINNDRNNEYILFYSSLRKNFQFSIFNFQLKPANVTIKTFKLPPSLLNIIWNKAHVFPIEYLIGNVDLFITSDWVEPPALRAKKATIIYDMIAYKYPGETHQKIVDTQKRKLFWVKNESSMVFCISEATKRDIQKILGINENRIRVIYPGIEVTSVNQ